MNFFAQTAGTEIWVALAACLTGLGTINGLIVRWMMRRLDFRDKTDREDRKDLLEALDRLTASNLTQTLMMKSLIRKEPVESQAEYEAMAATQQAQLLEAQKARSIRKQTEAQRGTE